MTLVEARGIFWPGGTEITSGHLAPDIAIGGLLTIDDGGKIKVALDGVFPRRGGGFAAILPMEEDQTAPTYIEGLLTEQKQHVLLLGTHKTGGQFNSSWISFESYLAAHALLSRSPFPRELEEIKFSELSVNLRGFEEWVGLSSIAFSEDGDKRVATYSHPDNFSYAIDEMAVSIEFDLVSPYPWPHLREISMSEQAFIRVKFEHSMGLEDVLREHLGIQDLLILLTDAERRLEWPELTIAGMKIKCTAYFGRHPGSDKASEQSDCLVLFPWISDDFGKIFQLWRSKRKLLGPGLYLYMGTRRGFPMYVEHRFVNLIWGLESLHRQKYPVKHSTSTRARIDSILGSISKLTDRKWLGAKLKYASELSLDQRLFDLISEIPIKFERKSLRTFVEKCAKSRNEISHFGNVMTNNYKDALRDLDSKSDAISCLYQILIMQEIGVAEKFAMLQFWEGFRSFGLQRALRDVGLSWEEREPRTAIPSVDRSEVRP